MTSNITINLAVQRVNPALPRAETPRKFFTPGEVICEQAGNMRGHGTYPGDECLKSSIAGSWCKVGCVVSVKPPKYRYRGESGDVVIGRIVEVQKDRWKVDTNGVQFSSLRISAVDLPGGEVRRRTGDDEKQIRNLFVEGDLISAEVHEVRENGSLLLHARNFKCRKLSQGVLVKVPPNAMRKMKAHFHNLNCGASLIFGNNGLIWISPLLDDLQMATGGFTKNEESVNLIPLETYQIITRLRNCILALVASKILLSDTSIVYAFEESKKYEIKELLSSEAMFDVALLTRGRLQSIEM